MISLEKLIRVFNENFNDILSGLITTLLLAVIGTVVGLILGIFLAYGKNIKVKESDNKVIKVLKILGLYFCKIYSTVLRGTPMMVQALIFKYACQGIGLYWEMVTFPAEISNVINGWLCAGLIVITLNTTAYMGEIIQSGLNGVDAGQTEGALSLGMSKGQASLLIILPQAIRNALPTIGNELIVNIKDSSVLNIIAVAELFYRFKDIATTNYAFLECYLLIAAIYLVLTIIASIAIKLIEKKLDGNNIFTNVFAKKEEF